MFHAYLDFHKISSQSQNVPVLEIIRELEKEIIGKTFAQAQQEWPVVENATPKEKKIQQAYQIAVLVYQLFQDIEVTDANDDSSSRVDEDELQNASVLPKFERHGLLCILLGSDSQKCISTVLSVR